MRSKKRLTPQVASFFAAGMAEAERERERRATMIALAYMVNVLESGDRNEIGRNESEAL